MEEKVYLDFGNPDSILTGLSKIYKISTNDLMSLVLFNSEQEELLNNFFKMTGVHPDTYPLSNIYIRCKLIGKYPDKKQLERDGLKSLKALLIDENSFLSRFLLQNGIVIDVGGHTLSYKGNLVDIDELDNLGCKLYHDNGEIEAFYCASLNSMISYSTISSYPEILYTLDGFIKKYFKVNEGLGEKWKVLTKGYDQISFYVNLDEISYINGYSDEWCEAYPYDEYYEEEYLYADSYPKLLFMNLWLLKYGFGILQGDMYDEFCLGIKSDVSIPFDELMIEHFN